MPQVIAGAWVRGADRFKDKPGFAEVFGEAGKGARAALGTNALPLGAAVEVESIFEIRV